MSEQSQSAAGAAAGFLFQLERALVKLTMAGPGHVVGIEVDDDIVRRSVHQEEFEQSKHSISSSIPFGDRSRDLWRTLSLWARYLFEGPGDPDGTTLYMVTNKVLPESRLAKQLSRAATRSQLSQAVTKLRQVGEDVHAAARQSADAVLAYDDSELETLVRQIEVVDGPQTTLSESARLNLCNHLYLIDVPADPIIQALLGWVLDQCLARWRAGEAAWVEWEAFARQANRLRDLYRAKLVVRAAAEIPVSEADRGVHIDRTFVRQLQLLRYDDEEIFLEAVDDFIRARSELARMAKAGEITRIDVDEYLDRLRRRWANVRRRHRAGLRSDSSDYQARACETGMRIYAECSDHREPLAGYSIEHPYFTCGHYHHLADLPDIGWHPDYRQLLGKREAE